MRDASPPMRYLVYALYVVDSVVAAILALPPYTLAKQLAVLAVLLGFLVFTVLLVFRRKETVRTHAPAAPAPAQLEDAQAGVVLGHLKSLRAIAYEALRQHDPALKDAEVRANVFFPRPSDDPAGYSLCIYPNLTLNMTEEDERGLCLKPNQGVTGNAFQTKTPKVALRLGTREAEGWDDKYDITPALAKVIHPDLKWVIAMPIKGDGGQVHGVLSVDGLRRQFDYDTLRDVMLTRLTDGVITVAKVIDGKRK